VNVNWNQESSGPGRPAGRKGRTPPDGQRVTSWARWGTQSGVQFRGQGTPGPFGVLVILGGGHDHIIPITRFSQPNGR
jgi:hypothetical protein